MTFYDITRIKMAAIVGTVIQAPMEINFRSLTFPLDMEISTINRQVCNKSYCKRMLFRKKISNVTKLVYRNVLHKT